MITILGEKPISNLPVKRHRDVNLGAISMSGTRRRVCSVVLDCHLCNGWRSFEGEKTLGIGGREWINVEGVGNGGFEAVRKIATDNYRARHIH